MCFCRDEDVEKRGRFLTIQQKKSKCFYGADIEAVGRNCHEGKAQKQIKLLIWILEFHS